jgi:glycine cleavage system T protein
MPEHTPLYEAAARAGAVFVDDAGWEVPGHFRGADQEYAAARAGAALFDLSHHGKVELTGADARTFLNNLCTNDVSNLPAGAGCEVFFTTAKAKVIAHGYLFHEGAGFRLDLAPGTADKVIRHLDHFLISEQVEFADRTRELAQLHVAGPQARALLTQALPDLPELGPLRHVTRLFRAATPCQVRRNDRLGVPGYDVLCPPGEVAEVWQALTAAGATPAGLQAFEALRIEAGTPRYGVDMDDNTFAPEAGRTAQAICYTKGCYLGQEPIVMARDRGQINRTLVGLALPEGPVPPRTAVFRAGKEVGHVTSSAFSPRSGAGVALAYLRRGNQEVGTGVEVDVERRRLPAQVVAFLR